MRASALLASACITALLAAQPARAQQETPASQRVPAALTDNEREHVAPDPPTHEMAATSGEAMARMMAMDDAARRGRVLLEQLDWRDTGSGGALAWNAQAWYGTDYNKLWLRTEGERIAGTTADARVEALWDHVFSRWWSAQTGARHDFGAGPARDWLAVGVAGLAPYFIAVEATAYLGDAGRTAARFRGHCELLISQRWILQPELEVNAYASDDPQRGIGSGVSELELGLRLRYEIRREFAPYFGLAWLRRFGKTADFARDAGYDRNALQALIGIRAWF